MVIDCDRPMLEIISEAKACNLSLVKIALIEADMRNTRPFFLRDSAFQQLLGKLGVGDDGFKLHF